jgi:hypothetical protein
VKITTILSYIERSKRIIIDGDAYIIWILQDNADRLSFAEVDNLRKFANQFVKEENKNDGN